MPIDFIASKLKKQFENIDDPLHLEVAEVLYEKYLHGEVEVEFVNGEAFYSVIKPEVEQLELPLE